MGIQGHLNTVIGLLSNLADIRNIVVYFFCDRISQFIVNCFIYRVIKEKLYKLTLPLSLLSYDLEDILSVRVK